MATRREFFKRLAGAAAIPATMVIGVDTTSAETKEKTAFNFMCACGNNLVAVVPEKEGEHVIADCACGAKLDLEWCGDHFKTRMRGNDHESFYM